MAKINPIRAGKVIKPFDPSGSSPFLQISASNRGISGLAQTVVTTVAELKNDIDQKADEERIYNKNTTQTSLLEKRLQEQMNEWLDDPNYSNLTPEEFDKKWETYEKKEFNDLKNKVYGNDPRAWGRFESAYYTVFNNNRRVFRRERLDKLRVDTAISVQNRRTERLKKAKTLHKNITHGQNQWKWRNDELKQINFDLKRYENVTKRKVTDAELTEIKDELNLSVWQSQLDSHQPLFDESGEINYSKVVDWLNDSRNIELNGEILTDPYRKELLGIYTNKSDIQIKSKEAKIKNANTKHFDNLYKEVLNWKDPKTFDEIDIKNGRKSITIDEIKNSTDSLGRKLNGNQIESLIGLRNKKISKDPTVDEDLGFGLALYELILQGKGPRTLLDEYSLFLGTEGNLVPNTLLNRIAEQSNLFDPGTAGKTGELHKKYTVLSDPRLSIPMKEEIIKLFETKIRSEKEFISVQKANDIFMNRAKSFKGKVMGTSFKSPASVERYYLFLQEKRKEFEDGLARGLSTTQLTTEYLEDGVTKNPNYIFDYDQMVIDKYIVPKSQQINDLVNADVVKPPAEQQIQGIDLGDPIAKVDQTGKFVYSYFDPTTQQKLEVSEMSIHFQDKKTKKWVVVPSIHNGQIFTEIQIQDMYRDGKIEAVSVHDSDAEAEAASIARSNSFTTSPLIPTYQEALEIGNKLPWDTLLDNEKQEYIKYFKQKYPGKDLPSSWNTP